MACASPSYPVPLPDFLHAPLDPAGGGALVLEADARGAEGGLHLGGVLVGELSCVSMIGG